jgi:hypothetical protein
MAQQHTKVDLPQTLLPILPVDMQIFQVGSFNRSSAQLNAG